jgi:hypothetical protein
VDVREVGLCYFFTDSTRLLRQDFRLLGEVESDKLYAWVAYGALEGTEVITILLHCSEFVVWRRYPRITLPVMPLAPVINATLPMMPLERNSCLFAK